MKHEPWLKQAICPMCHKRAYMDRVIFLDTRKGWSCLRCKSWWTDGAYDKIVDGTEMMIRDIKRKR